MDRTDTRWRCFESTVDRTDTRWRCFESTVDLTDTIWRCFESTVDWTDLTRFNKIATQGAPQMAVDRDANSLSRVYSYYSKFNLCLFYV